MDDRRFDRLTRAFAIGASRRKALLGAAAIGATALVSSRRSEAQSPAPDAATLCAGDGQPCVMLTGCCSGFTCVTSAINPNQGFCQSGGTGGVQIAPPLMAGNADGSTTQAAPTRTPRTHKTHTPGSNHTNTNTNTNNRQPTELKITSFDCYTNGDGSVIPHITLRNTGYQAVKLGNLQTLKNDNYKNSDTGSPLDIQNDGRLKPKRSLTYVQQGATYDGNIATVALPDDFFSAVRGEGVLVTYESADGLSTFTVQRNCPDSAPNNGANMSASERKKKRRR